MNSEVVELCSSLVSIPSINPQQSACDDRIYGESRMTAFVLDWLNGFRIDAELQRVSAGRDNVLATAEGSDTSKTLLLTAHMDTVDVKAMTIAPFGGEVRDGRIYGRGACDDKGPLAAMMLAFRDRVNRGRLPCNLALLATCDEEFGMTGSSHYAQHFGTSLIGGIFAEPTDFQVVAAHKGVVRLKLASTGRSAHSSRPDLGENAIYPMARAISAVERFAGGLSTRLSHALLGSETFSVTIVQGGQQINIIPDSCTAQIDWRILPGRTGDNCLDELSALLDSQCDGDVSVELINQFAPMDTDPTCPLVILLSRAAERTVGLGRVTSVGYATDASAFVDLPIPTPVFGPGDGTCAHTADEYIDIDKLELGLAAYSAFLDGDWPA